MYKLILMGFWLGLTWADLKAPGPGRGIAVSRPGHFSNWTGVTEKETFCESTTPYFICVTSPPGNTNILCTDLGSPQRELAAILVCGCGNEDGTGGDALLNPAVYSFCEIVTAADEDPDSVYCVAQCIYCNERALICTDAIESICLCFCGDPFPRNGILGIANA